MATDPIANERDLWTLWAGRRLPASLTTRDGRALRVLFPGLANSGPGPDFTGALLAFDGGHAQRGDVELHLDASSWTAHGHHLDPRYATVILHVVLLDDATPARTVDDAVLPVLALGPLLAASQRPRKVDAEAGPCRNPNAARAAPDALRAAILEAGQARFAERAAAWEGELEVRPVEDCVLRALLRTAGMGRNAEACALLAAALDGATLEQLLSGSRHTATAVATATVLGMAGLLEQAGADDTLRLAWQQQRDYWPGRPLDARQWQRFRLRPANLPETRLRAVAAILAPYGLRGLLETLAELIEREPACTLPTLLAPITPEHTLVGRAWALEAWTNVLLPLLAAYGATTGRPALVGRAGDRYRALPGGGENRVLERMRAVAGLASVPKSAVEQQGLLHIWARHCSQQACAGCPVRARLEA